MIHTASVKSRYFNLNASNKTFFLFMPFSFVMVQEDEGTVYVKHVFSRYIILDHFYAFNITVSVEMSSCVFSACP